MPNKKKKQRKKIASLEDINSFPQFAAVFTIIFVVMAIVIIEVMRGVLYWTTDNNLQNISKTPSEVINLTLGNNSSMDFPPEPKKNDMTVNINTNINIIVFDKKGNRLNKLNNFSGIDKLKLNTDHINEIQSYQTKNIFGREETFHGITVKLKNGSKLFKGSRYAMILTSTTQLDNLSFRYKRSVIIIMVVFWIISILVSVYLSKWSAKPILESYKRQKSFVENASHELRTPLAVLQNRLESLFRKPDSTILDRSQDIGASLDEVRNMKILTHNLLDIARRDGGLVSEIAPISPDFFNNILDNYEMIAQENAKDFKGNNLITDIVYTDPNLVKQLLTILFDNAIKYTDENGQIEMSLHSDDKYIAIVVSDNGLGISDEDKTKIFDRFYRVDKARNRQIGGFGLGLSLAKQIVTTLEGTILVSDRKPQGTIFEIKLKNKKAK